MLESASAAPPNEHDRSVSPGLKEAGYVERQNVQFRNAIKLDRRLPERVKGCPSDYVGSTSGVPDIAADRRVAPARRPWANKRHRARGYMTLFLLRQWPCHLVCAADDELRGRVGGAILESDNEDGAQPNR
jgi:hypothetical protein